MGDGDNKKSVDRERDWSKGVFMVVVMPAVALLATNAFTYLNWKTELKNSTVELALERQKNQLQAQHERAEREIEYLKLVSAGLLDVDKEKRCLAIQLVSGLPSDGISAGILDTYKNQCPREVLLAIDAREHQDDRNDTMVAAAKATPDPDPKTKAHAKDPPPPTATPKPSFDHIKKAAQEAAERNVEQCLAECPEGEESPAEIERKRLCRQSCRQ